MSFGATTNLPCQGPAALPRSPERSGAQRVPTWVTQHDNNDLLVLSSEQQLTEQGTGA